MGRIGDDREVILFCYDDSVFSRRMEYYLGLRGAKYSRCLQPLHMPRPDLAALGIKYRRIPVLAVGRDIYLDTRIMTEKLEQRYPADALGSREPFKRGIEKMIEDWTMNAGPYWRTAATVPLSSPSLNDPVWMRDRFEGSGGAFTREALAAERKSAMADLNGYFSLAEHCLLADGRRYLLDTEEPSLADINAIWTYDWAISMHAQASTGENIDQEPLNSSRFPKVYAWVKRFRSAHSKAVDKTGGPPVITSEDARQRILNSTFTECEPNSDVCDPLGLTKGQLVDVAPTDFGFTHRDRGRLVALNLRECVIEVQVPGGDHGSLRLHYPRAGFRIEPVHEIRPRILRDSLTDRMETFGALHLRDKKVERDSLQVGNGLVNGPSSSQAQRLDKTAG